jgi:spore coat polysaccharide biosynthesis protein SpsF
MSKKLSDQEKFWQGDFGTDYIDRNKSNQLLSSNVSMFSRIFDSLHDVSTIAEFGCNVGMNLRALRSIFPDMDLTGIDINPDAINHVNEWAEANGILGSIVDLDLENKFDLTFTKGVLIHINPDLLNSVYENLYKYSKRYILVAEYYNPSPVTIEYRGEMDRLFKRDFAGDMLDKYQDLKLVDYGFVYKRDTTFPQDDITWFLMEKS